MVRRLLNSISLGTLLLCLPLNASLAASAADSVAEDPSARGLTIVTEAERRNQGWGDVRSHLRMELRNAQGDTSERRLRTRTLEVEGDGDKGLTIFDQPRDVQGTAFLTFTHALIPDDQWIYLPALKRVKRISSRNKSGPFMGSEFAYEDMSSFEVEKYRYRYLRDEVLDGLDCFVVESYPNDENSGYTRLVSWFDKQDYQTRKIEYFDRKDSALKTLILSDYQQYLEQYWRPLRLQMTNLQTGKSTLLSISEIRFRTGLEDADFNRNSLSRVR
ncbi:MAG: outer membrane lipoprotein-sorting protein [Motiliproteus sp.]|jgi:outer membrane lipoprotein-sorting protein